MNTLKYRRATLFCHLLNKKLNWLIASVPLYCTIRLKGPSSCHHSLISLKSSLIIVFSPGWSAVGLPRVLKLTKLRRHPTCICNHKTCETRIGISTWHPVSRVPEETPRGGAGHLHVIRRRSHHLFQNSFPPLLTNQLSACVWSDTECDVCVWVR